MKNKPKYTQESIFDKSDLYPDRVKKNQIDPQEQIAATKSLIASNTNGKKIKTFEFSDDTELDDNKSLIWLNHYLNPDNPHTFMNANNSTRVSGFTFDTQEELNALSARLYRSYKDVIRDWLDKTGMSETMVLQRLTKLMFATETKFFTYKGQVVETREVENLGIQMSAVQLATKVKGMTVEKINHEMQGYKGAIVPKVVVNLVKGTGRRDKIEVENVIEIESNDGRNDNSS